MADDPLAAPPRDDADETPRWVKVSGIVFIVLVLVFAILHIAGKGLHGHTPAPAHGAGTHPSGGQPPSPRGS